MSQFDDYKHDKADGIEQPQTMSLMGGIAGGGSLPGDDFGVDETRESKRIGQQSMLIGMIVSVVAFGTLAGLRLTQTSVAASSISPETQQFMDSIEVKIANLNKMDPADPLNPKNIKSLFKDTADIVAAIEDDPTAKQVPLDQVQMNPFRPIVKEKKQAVTVDNTEKLRTDRINALYAELAKIEVQSLVGGGRPRAFIGGELYKVGDQLGSFTVKSIDHRRVEFEAAGLVLRPGEAGFVLGMGGVN